MAMNDNSKDITAIFDGTWQRRGYTSLNGVVTAIIGINGKCLSIEYYVNIAYARKDLKIYLLSET